MRTPFEGDGEREGAMLLAEIFNSDEFKKRKTRILHAVRSQRVNRGLHWRRTKHVNYFDNSSPNMEKIISEAWEVQNDPPPYLNYGTGTLDGLMSVIVDRGVYRDEQIIEPTKRERMIAATVLQWLGTNCGFAFISECFDKCGYKIVKK